MADVTTLRRPWVITPTSKHTHTVVFLHQQNPDASAVKQFKRLLSEKKTKNGVTLREQFPSVRWVFPRAKLFTENGDSLTGTKVWTEVSEADLARLDLLDQTGRSDTIGRRYITGVVSKEAGLVDHTDKLILGGIGTGSEAAFEVLRQFPGFCQQTSKSGFLESCARGNEPKDGRIRVRFGNDYWAKVEDVKFGGFFGMLGYDAKPTGEERDSWVLTTHMQGKITVQGELFENTPNRFIRGGYRYTKENWDGHRVDEFADFLSEIGVYRIPNDAPEEVAIKDDEGSSSVL
ncbi:hypothetical protein F4780DRAFT_757134 [Xylariomycetidae sp. FL0641]|nr:hypothetical protein F4780DRAFT_757134 [Xylariomycetidae sp. FL0641]